MSCCRNHNIVGVCVFNITECCFCRVGQYACFRAGRSQCHFTCDGYFWCLNIIVLQAGKGCNCASAFKISCPAPDGCRIFNVSRRRRNYIISICVFNISECDNSRVSFDTRLSTGRLCCDFVCDSHFGCLNVVTLKAGKGCHSCCTVFVALPCPDGNGIFKVSRRRNHDIVCVCVFHITESCLCRIGQYACSRAGGSQCHFTCNRNFRCLNIVVFQTSEGCNGTSAFEISCPAPDGSRIFDVSCCRNDDIVSVCVFYITESGLCRVGQYAGLRAGRRFCHSTCDGDFRCLNIVVFQAGEGCYSTSAFKIGRPCPDRSGVFFVSCCRNDNIVGICVFHITESCLCRVGQYAGLRAGRSQCYFTCDGDFRCLNIVVFQAGEGCYGTCAFKIRCPCPDGCGIFFMSGLYENRNIGCVTARTFYRL